MKKRIIEKMVDLRKKFDFNEYQIFESIELSKRLNCFFFNGSFIVKDKENIKYVYSCNNKSLGYPFTKENQRYEYFEFNTNDDFKVDKWDMLINCNRLVGAIVPLSEKNQFIFDCYVNGKFKAIRTNIKTNDIEAIEIYSDICEFMGNVQKVIIHNKQNKRTEIIL